MLADKQILIFLFAISSGSGRRNSIKLFVLNFIISNSFGLQPLVGRYKAPAQQQALNIIATSNNLKA
jgi:hypothetical protein